jgi:hypothetical protein
MEVHDVNAHMCRQVMEERAPRNAQRTSEATADIPLYIMVSTSPNVGTDLAQRDRKRMLLH